MKPFLLLALLLCPAFAAAQEPADMAAEPPHHLLVKNDRLRVFGVTLDPTEQAFVRHDHNFLVITLQDCEIVLWSEGQSAIQSFHFGKGDVRFSFRRAPAGNAQRQDDGVSQHYRRIS